MVFVSADRASSWSFPCGEFTEQDLARESGLLHSDNVSRPSKTMPYHDGFDASAVCFFKDSVVGYIVLPFDVENGTELLLVETFKLLDVITIKSPCFAAIL